MDGTVLDQLLATQPVTPQPMTVSVHADDLVHVVGTQEPVRDHTDERARALLKAGWLEVDYLKTDMTDEQRLELVGAIQQAARTWLKSPEAQQASAMQREQVRWVNEKTRSHESKQQIVQRLWLAAVLYGLGYRKLSFDQEGQIHWDEGTAGRIGISPDSAIDLAWLQAQHQTYTASFRDSTGMVARGKGRHRWHIYRLRIDPAADWLFAQFREKVDETIALIVASESYATQPQLPRDFYGSNEFQQACIDAQDQHFTHMLVLSPEHGVISLDDVVPSDQFWDNVLERRVWNWQMKAIYRLSGYLLESEHTLPKDINWWAWLNPDSTYRLTVFGAGFPVRLIIDHLVHAKARQPENWPTVVLVEQRPGYDIGEYEDNFTFEHRPFDDDDDDNAPGLPSVMQDIDQLIEWATEFAEMVTVYVPPTGEIWELAPDEAVIPVRVLTEATMDIEDLLDLLVDITLLLEQPLPFSLLVNAPMVVSVLLQIAHSMVHNEPHVVFELADTMPEGVIQQYIEMAMQEPSQEDRLCACLTLAEQMQLLAINIPQTLNDQLLTWLQTYLSARMRQRLLGNITS